MLCPGWVSGSTTGIEGSGSMRLRLTAIRAAKCNRVRMPRPMDSPLRYVLTLIAVVAVLRRGGLRRRRRERAAAAAPTPPRRRRPRPSPLPATPRPPSRTRAPSPSSQSRPARPRGSSSRRTSSQGTGPGAKPGDTVVVHYVGMNFSNGQEFDASWDAGAPFPVELGTGGVIAGWEKGLVGIKEGGPAQAHDPAGARLRRAGLSARHPTERDARVRDRRRFGELSGLSPPAAAAAA